MVLVEDKTEKGTIFYIVLNGKYNAVNRYVIQKFNQFIDVIESSKGPAVLVTVNSPKSKAFSAGFDFNAMLKGQHEGVLMPMEMLKVYARILTINIPSMCIVRGHCIAAGMLIACCHDKVIMNGNPKLKIQFPEHKLTPTMHFYAPFA